MKIFLVDYFEFPMAQHQPFENIVSIYSIPTLLYDTAIEPTTSEEHVNEITMIN